MKITRLGLWCLGLFCASALEAAQPADPCAAANNTIEINECMSQQFVAVDRELNRAYQDLLSGKSDAFELLDQVQALEKLGVTEGTLAERQPSVM